MGIYKVDAHHPSELIQKPSQLQAKVRDLGLFAILYTRNESVLSKYVSSTRRAPSNYRFYHTHEVDIAKGFNTDEDGSVLRVFSRLED